MSVLETRLNGKTNNHSRAPQVRSIIVSGTSAPYYTFYQKFLGVPTLGVNTKTRRRRHGVGYSHFSSYVGSGPASMYKDVGVAFYFIFLKYPMKMKQFGLTETILFHFHRIF